MEQRAEQTEAIKEGNTESSVKTNKVSRDEIKSLIEVQTTLLKELISDRKRKEEEMLGGYMGGMQVANNARAERQLRMQREKLEAEGRAFGAEMEARQREYEKALGEISSSKEKTVMRQLEKSRIREDANDAFMQYVDGGFDGNLADIIGGFYGEGALPKGFV